MDPGGFRSTERWRPCATWMLKYMTRLDDEIREMARDGLSIREIKSAKGVGQEHVKRGGL